MGRRVSGSIETRATLIEIAPRNAMIVPIDDVQRGALCDRLSIFIGCPQVSVRPEKWSYSRPATIREAPGNYQNQSLRTRLFERHRSLPQFPKPNFTRLIQE